MTALRSGSATDVGRVRSSNQDVALEDPDLFAVADGMGGHVGGEVAARVAVDALRAAFQRQPSVEGLRQAVAEANRAVWHQSQTESGLRGMGTTLTATALVRDTPGRQVIALANVGDSRAYVFSKGAVIQVTADHSLAEEKVRQGELTEAEAAVHPHRHILTRALGVSSDVDVDLWELHLQTGDRILLCSDGLTNEVDDRRIGEVLSSTADPRQAAAALVRAAVEHGGSDNVTVVVVDVVPDDQGTGAPGTGVGSAGGAVPSAGAMAAGAGAGDSAGLAGADFPDHSPGIGGDGPAGGDGPGGGVTGAAGTGAPGAVAASGTRSGQPAGGVLVADDRSGAADATGVVPAQPRDGMRSPAAGVGTAPWRPTTAPPRLTRRERRRRRRMAGIPRLVTFRVVLFFVLLGALVYAAYYLVRWYAMDDWYVTVDHSHLVIYRGRPGGFLWFKPQLIDTTSVTTADVLPFHLPTLRRDVQRTSAAAARRYVANLHQEFVTAQQLGSGVTPSAGTSAPTSPSTSTSTSTTAPSSSSTSPAAAG